MTTLSDLAFYSASCGWAVAVSPRGSEQYGKYLLTTDDDGQIWTVIESTDGSLPRAGGQPRVVFTSTERGYLLNPNGIDLGDALWHTTDGDHHWHTATPRDPLPQGMAQRAPTAMLQDDCLGQTRHRCLVLVAMLGSDQRAMPLVLRQPRRAEQAWQAYHAAGLPERSDSGAYGDRATFVTPRLGFLVDDGRLYRSGDAGQHWQTVDMPDSPVSLGPGLAAYTLRFQDKCQGELYIADGGQAAVSRFTTADAERHWHSQP